MHGHLEAVLLPLRPWLLRGQPLAGAGAHQPRVRDRRAHLPRLDTRHHAAHLSIPQVAEGVNCLHLDTAGNGTGYGKWINYYWSRLGIALSAALRHDYMGVGYPNAPPTTNGQKAPGAAAARALHAARLLRPTAPLLPARRPPRLSSAEPCSHPSPSGAEQTITSGPPSTTPGGGCSPSGRSTSATRTPSARP